MKKLILIILFLLFCSSSYSNNTFGSATIYKSRNNRDVRRVLPLGDSITVGENADDDDFGYRDHLQDLLNANNGLIYDFVGPNQTPASSSTHDIDHAGVNNERTDEIEARLSTALSTYMTNAPSGSMVTIHAGNNDIAQSVDPNVAVANVEDMIDIIHAFDSNIDVYIMLIIPRVISLDAETTVYNGLLRAMVETYQITKSNVYIVDTNTAMRNDTFGICSGDYEANCYPPSNNHPNDLGYQVMANQIARCVENRFNPECDTFVPNSEMIGYYKSHTITGSSDGLQTNYQIPITVNYGSGTDSGDTVYLNSRPLADFSDVHFKAANNSTELDFWIESSTDSSTADFWVEVPNIPASPDTTTIYIYYGSGVAQTNSAGNTFLAAYDPRIATDSMAVTTIDSATGYSTIGQDRGVFIPLGTSGQFDDNFIREIGNIVYDPTDTGKEYKIYYSGNDGSQTWLMSAYASSLDGTWTKHGRSVTTEEGEDPYVFKDGASSYYMYYENIPNTAGGRYATSSNGLDFTVAGTITGNAQTTYNVVSPIVWKEGAGDYHMIYEQYSSTPRTARYATSSNPNGPWTDQAEILSYNDAGSGWYDADDIVPDDIVKIGNTYYMSYHSTVNAATDSWTDSMAYTTTLDTTWNRYASNPFSSVADGAVITDGGGMNLMFSPDDNETLYYVTKSQGLHFASWVNGSDFKVESHKMNAFDVISGALTMEVVDSAYGGIGLFTQSDIGLASNFSIRTRKKIESGKEVYTTVSFGTGSGQSENEGEAYWQVVGNGYVAKWRPSDVVRILQIAGNEPTTLTTSLQDETLTAANKQTMADYEFFYLDDGTFGYERNGTDLISPALTDTTYLTGNKRIGIGQGNIDTDVGGLLTLEYIVVRKRVANEPTHGSWGSETQN